MSVSGNCEIMHCGILIDMPYSSGLLSQLLEPEESKLGDGKIRDSNRITLITLLTEHGLTVNDMGIAKDRLISILTDYQTGNTHPDCHVTDCQHLVIF